MNAKNMNRFRGILLIAAVFAFALGILLMPPQAQAHCTTDPDHNASHQKDPCNKGGGGDDGKDQLSATFFDDASFSGIQSDGGDLYVNGEPGVDVTAGGAGKRIRLDLNSDGSLGLRFLNVDIMCKSGCDPDRSFSGEVGSPDPATFGKFAVLDIFHAADMPADGLFRVKNATFQIGGGLPDGEIRWEFWFRDPGEFNPGGSCAGPNGAGTPVWVARFDDGTWEVTTQDPPPGDIAPDETGANAGEVACLEVSTSAKGTEFGGNYSIPFFLTVGPESVLSAP